MTDYDPPAVEVKVTAELLSLLRATIRATPVLFDHPATVDDTLAGIARMVAPQIVAIVNDAIVADDNKLTELSAGYLRETLGATELPALHTAALKLTSDEWNAVWHDGAASVSARSKLAQNSQYGKCLHPDHPHACRYPVVPQDQRPEDN